jgi:hypothetical protein
MYLNGNGRAIPAVVTGASLARRLRAMTAAQRACSAADVDDGRTPLVDLTAKSIAALHQVSMPYLLAAKKLSPEEREQVRRGERPLVQPKAKQPELPLSLAEFDDVKLIEAIRTIGVERTLEAATAVEAQARANA